MTAFIPRGTRWLEIGAILALFLIIHVAANDTDLATSADCYYNYNHYSEGDRILTNEPCLNCTCHNKMLMCYLKVCPFTKPIGQDCTIEKREDQCCPIITCPEVPVELDHSSSQSTTDLATHQNHGCSIDGDFYPEGAQIPGNPKKPCELCYCIRNMTSCVMQECTLHVDGCRPIYNKGVCCPVRYDCARDDDLPLMLEDQTTTEAPSQGFVITTTSAPVPSNDCYHNGLRYIDGENIDTEQACEHCYCMRGDIVCAVQECKPLEMHGKNCSARTPGPGECCPQVYECESDLQSTTVSDQLDESSAATTTLGYKDDAAEPVLTTTQEAVVVSSSEHFEKGAIPTEPSSVETTSHGIDESENEIHDKDYDHMTVKPSRGNFTAVQQPDTINDRIEGEESTTLLNKLDDSSATTILAESGSSGDEKITTVLPMAGQPQQASKDDTENEGILSNLYTTIKSIVELATTLGPVEEPAHKPHEDDEFLSNVIPGEGDCLDNGISYANNTSVPPRNVCDESCLCHNSIVRCEKVKCAPMPPNAENCKVLHEDGLCCPSYHCESMEFNTGAPSTQSAENQVIHRDEQQSPQVEGTTAAQSVEEEEQTNAIDSKLDDTTPQSAAAVAPISSKLDDTYEMKPEATTIGASVVEKETNAPETESSPAKVEQEMPSELEEKFGTEPAKTEPPAKEEIASEPSKSEAESTTLKQQEEQEQKIDEQPEIMQPTTDKAAEEMPEDAQSQPDKLHDEGVDAAKESALDVTTQAQSEQSDELSPTTQKVQQDADVSTEDQKEKDSSTEPQSQESQPTEHDEQKPEEIGTTETPLSQKGPTEEEISTESHKDSDTSTESLSESQPESQPEKISTEEPSGQKVEADISTEPQKAEDEPQTTQPEIQGADEVSVTEEGVKLPEEPSSTEQQRMDEQPIEATTIADQPNKLADEVSSSENQAEEENLIPDSTTDGHIVQHAEIEKQPEPAEKIEDEQVTTEKPPASESEQKPSEDESLPQTTQASDPKLSDESQEKGEEESVVPTTGAPVPSESIDRLPEINEISSENIPEEHKTEDDLPAPTTESEQTANEAQPESADNKVEPVTDGQISSEDAHILGQESPSEKPEMASTDAKQEQPSSTEQGQEESTTLATSKLDLGGIDMNQFKEGDVVSEEDKQDFDLVEPTTVGKSQDEAASSTEPVQQSEVPEQKQPEEQFEQKQPELTSSEGIEESIATDSPAPEQPVSEEQPAIAPSQDEQHTEEPLVSDEKVTTEKQAEATTTYVFPSKQEDLEIVTEKIVPSKQEDLEIVTSAPEKETSTEPHDVDMKLSTESKSQAELEPSTEASSESEATTAGKVSEEQPPSFDDTFLEDQHIPPAATEKEHMEHSSSAGVEQSEQTTFSVMPDKPSEGTDMKQDEHMPTDASVARPELEAGNQMHITDDDAQSKPELESSVTTEAIKQEPAATTSAPSVVTPEESVNRIGEEETVENAEKTQQPTAENAVSEEAPKEDEKTEEEQQQPIHHIQMATTEENIIDVTTLLNKIHDESISQGASTESGAEEISTQKQEQPETPAQTESQSELDKSKEEQKPTQEIELSQEPEIQQQTTEYSQTPELTEQQTQESLTPQQPQEQPQSTSAPMEHDEKIESQPSAEGIAPEQPAIPVENDATTEGVQQSTQQNQEIPAEGTTEQSKDEKPMVPLAPITPSQDEHKPEDDSQEQSSTGAPILMEEHTTPQQQQQQEQEVVTDSKSEGEVTTQKDESIEQQQSSTEGIVSPVPVEGSSSQTGVSETTTYEQEAIATSEPSKPLIAHDEFPAVEESSQSAESSSASQKDESEEQSSTQPSLLDQTTIKSVVDLIQTLSPIVFPQEPEVTTVAQAAEQEPSSSEPSIFNRVDADSSSAPSVEHDYQTTESVAAENKTGSIEQQSNVYATPPESANKIPLIREPTLNEITTKLAESFDTTTLPSILFTSSHTERISDSTTIKNTQNEITESTHDMGSGVGSQPSFPPSFEGGYGGNVPSEYPEEYTDEEEPTVFGPGTCRYGGKLYVSAQQIPRDDPCDFCFCFRSDIICLQQSCPPPINGCHEEPIQGFCCPRYECPVSMGLVLNTTTTTTTTLPPYLSHFQRNSGKVTRSGCQIQGITYKIGERVTTASGPCIDCICGGDGQMKCDPKVCTPEPMLRQMIASAKRR